MSASWSGLASDISEIADEWRANRPERQARRSLDPADFDRLAKAGFLHVAVPEQTGGLWRSVAETTRPICETLRTLAAADPSVALVASMHPAVLGFWLARPDESRPQWTEQRAAVFATAADGAQWGTITSEPGSGGDILRTKAQATADGSSDGPVPGAAYRISGDKHFGSGSGVTSFMITTAVADGEDAPTMFALDVRDRPWDGTAGLRLTAEWDGMGMAATQSHAMRLEACPAIRFAWDGPLEEITLAAAPLVSSLFTAVILGVLDEAIAHGQAATGTEGRCAAPVRAGRVDARRARPLARRAGLRGCAAGRGVRRPRPIAARHAARRRRPSRSWPNRRSAASPGSSAVGRSRDGRRSPRGSRTSAPSASSGPRGDSPTTACSSLRSPDGARARCGSGGGGTRIAIRSWRRAVRAPRSGRAWPRSPR